MARLENGINGPFKGKVGSVVGYQWKDIHCVRSLPGKNKNRTAEQRSNENKFARINKWLEPFKPFTSLGLMHYSGRMTAYNAAYSLNHRLFPTSESTGEIDYSSMILSEGPLVGAIEPIIVFGDNNQPELHWKNHYKGNSKQHDELMLLLYFPGRSESTFHIGEARRADSKSRIPMATASSDETAEVFIAFISLDRKLVSKSQYLGKLDILSLL